MDMAANVTARPHSVSANRLWSWALSLLVILSGGPKPGLMAPTDFTSCDYNMEVDSSYANYIFSPGFESGETYPPGSACRWYVTSPSGTHVELDCGVFRVGGMIPGTDQCGGDRFYVTPTGDPSLTDAEVHCGEGGFSVTSVWNVMAVVFQSDFEDDPMDMFVCTVTGTSDQPLPCD